MIFVVLLIYSFLMSIMMISSASIDDAHSIYVPRQLSYNPILENALTYNVKNKLGTTRNYCMLDNDRASSSTIDAQPFTWNYICSVKPIYTQTIGKSLQQYFTINNIPCPVDIRENGLGSIDSLWLQVSAYPAKYQSTLILSPSSKIGGSLLFFQAQLPCDFSLSIDTALIHMSNTLNMVEKDVLYTGTSRFATVTQALASSDLCYGKICGTHGKTGLDDIQVKIIKNLRDAQCYHWDVYGLLGIPTGVGSKAHHLFEPLVGSKHVQLGLGTSAQANMYEADWGSLSFLGEVKWRYGFKATEKRSFDLKCNGQWSRYMLLAPQTNPYAVFPAINTLTFKTSVTPQNSLDVYLALHGSYRAWHFELGYDFWYRSAEKVHIKECSTVLGTEGIADLLGIANHHPHTASTANITQGLIYSLNQMVSDSTFVPLTLADIRYSSGSAPQSASNSIYASLGYLVDWCAHPMEFGVSASYERGTSAYKADTVSGWVSFDIYI